ncbi:MAG TPA: hypothetical protein VEY50_12540 [Lysobacter sp.]|nr:hypothetical protein [Lysobacter sp.]
MMRYRRNRVPDGMVKNARSNLHAALVLGVAFALASCGGGNPSTPAPASTGAESLIEHATVLKVDTSRQDTHIDVRLKTALSEAELEQLARQLHKREGVSTKHALIGFYLPEHALDQGAWAVAQIGPEGTKIQLFGATAEQLAKSQPPRVTDGELLGTWRDTNPMFAGWVQLVKRPSGVTIERTLAVGGDKPGPHMVDPLQPHKNDSRRFDDVEGENGEYYVLTDDGALEHHAPDHLIARHERVTE